MGCGRSSLLFLKKEKISHDLRKKNPVTLHINWFNFSFEVSGTKTSEIFPFRLCVLDEMFIEVSKETPLY